jgi:hypothetical protein
MKQFELSDPLSVQSPSHQYLLEIASNDAQLLAQRHFQEAACLEAATSDPAMLYN